MNDVIAILQKQLDIELEGAKTRLTSNNLDTIYKLTVSINNLKGMMRPERVEKPDQEPVMYTDGKYDRNVDALYEKYMTAKKAYQINANQQNKDKMMESLSRLMSEINDLLSGMYQDCDIIDERKEIQRHIKRLGDL